MAVVVGLHARDAGLILFGGLVTGPVFFVIQQAGEDGDRLFGALFPKSTIKPQLPQPQVTVTLGAF